MNISDKLSVVVITFNEEKNIARCIESVKEIADEILILDSGSTDKTKEIALSYDKVKFYIHSFDGHIQQKNRAKNLATYDWVLSLDADEALDAVLLQSIYEIKGKWEKQGYYMNRLTNYCGHWVRHSNWYPDRKLRLWNRHKGEWKGINPHDKFEMYEGNKVTGFIKGNILHYSYYSLEDHYKQVEYFTSIASKAYVEKNMKAPWWKLIVNPTAKFIDHYLLHLGFLDGVAGWHIARISAYATYLKYKKIKALYKTKK